MIRSLLHAGVAFAALALAAGAAPAYADSDPSLSISRSQNQSDATTSQTAADRIISIEDAKIKIDGDVARGLYSANDGEKLKTEVIEAHEKIVEAFDKLERLSKKDSDIFITSSDVQTLIGNGSVIFNKSGVAKFGGTSADIKDQATEIYDGLKSLTRLGRIVTDNVESGVQDSLSALDTVMAHRADLISASPKATAAERLAAEQGARQLHDLVAGGLERQFGATRMGFDQIDAALDAKKQEVIASISKVIETNSEKYGPDAADWPAPPAAKQKVHVEGPDPDAPTPGPAQTADNTPASNAPSTTDNGGDAPSSQGDAPAATARTGPVTHSAPVDNTATDFNAYRNAPNGVAPAQPATSTARAQTQTNSPSALDVGQDATNSAASTGARPAVNSAATAAAQGALNTGDGISTPSTPPLNANAGGRAADNAAAAASTASAQTYTENQNAAPASNNGNISITMDYQNPNPSPSRLVDWPGGDPTQGSWTVGDSYAAASQLLATLQIDLPDEVNPLDALEVDGGETMAQLVSIYQGYDLGSYSTVPSPVMTSLGLNLTSLDLHAPVNISGTDALHAGMLPQSGSTLAGGLFSYDGYDMPWNSNPIASTEPAMVQALYADHSGGNYLIQHDPNGEYQFSAITARFVGYLDDGAAYLSALSHNDAGGLDRLTAQPFNVLLTWGAGAYDLDLHLTGPTGEGQTDRFHIFFEDRGSQTAFPYAELIKDCICSSGSEVILTSQLVKGGVYRVSVFDYGDQSATSMNLSNQSGATLEIVRGGTAVSQGNGTTIVGGHVIYVGTPPSGKAGNTWTGVEINPQTGRIYAPNTITQSPGSTGVH